jgi:hypothetical protein
MMTRSVLFIALFALIFFSCKRSRQETLIGSWHAVKLENPEMDSFFVKSQAFIDTMGKNGDAATNLQVYGVTNMDSLRQAMQHQFDSAKVMQQSSVLNTQFKFRKDSVAILAFNGNVDSAKWHIEGNILVMEDMNKETEGQKLHMEILALTDTVMKLKFEENGASSTVTFNPDAK